MRLRAPDRAGSLEQAAHSVTCRSAVYTIACVPRNSWSSAWRFLLCVVFFNRLWLARSRRGLWRGNNEACCCIMLYTVCTEIDCRPEEQVAVVSYDLRVVSEPKF